MQPANYEFSALMTLVRRSHCSISVLAMPSQAGNCRLISIVVAVVAGRLIPCHLHLFVRRNAACLRGRLALRRLVAAIAVGGVLMRA